MKDLPYKNYKELVELIPLIQEAAIKGLERDRIENVYNNERIRRRAAIFKEVFKIIQGKWTIEIFYAISMHQKCGYNDIRRALPKVNSRTLTDRLKELEIKGLISRTVKGERPLRVYYTLTDFGKGSMALLVPFLTYLILPVRYRKELPKLPSI